MVVIDASGSSARKTGSGRIGVTIEEFGILFDGLFSATPIAARTNATQAVLRNETGFGRIDEITYFGTIPPLPSDLAGELEWRLALGAMTFSNVIIETTFTDVSPDPQTIEITVDTPQRGDWFGNNTSRILEGDDRIIGSAFADTLAGGTGNDRLLGGRGNDRIDGGAGDDRIEGGSGNDRLNGSFDNDVVKGGAGNDRIQGGSGDDKLTGAAGKDTIDGEAGDDRIDGGGSNDTLDGGDGDDRIEGGGGNDILFGGRGGDTQFGGAGDDKIWNNNKTDTGLYAPEKEIMNGGSGDDAFNIRLFQRTAGARDNPNDGKDPIIEVDGGGGRDMLSIMHPAGPTLQTGAAVYVNDGKETGVFLSYGNRTLAADGGIKLTSVEVVTLPMLGTDFFTFLMATETKSTMTVTKKGALTIQEKGGVKLVLEPQTGPGAAEGALILGGLGNDMLDLSGLKRGFSVLLGGGGGNDTLIGSKFDDFLEGGAGDDVLSGGKGDDALLGTRGANRLSGGAGDDVIGDGTGRDRLTGGAGADQFGLVDDGKTDIITDFDPRQGDMIAIDGLLRFGDLSFRNLSDGGVSVLHEGETTILRDPNNLLSAGNASADWFDI